MQVNVWGPSLWHSIHIMAQNFSPDRRVGRKSARVAYREFFDSLRFVLPCSHCRENYPRNKKAAEERLRRSGATPFDSRKSMAKFAYLLHDEVNRCTGKGRSPSFTEVYRFYEQFRSRCAPKRSDVKEDGCYQPMNGLHPCYVQTRFMARTPQGPAPIGCLSCRAPTTGRKNRARSRAARSGR